LNRIIEWRGRTDVIHVVNGPEHISGKLPLSDALHRLAEGALCAMIGLAQNDKSPLGSGLDVGCLERSVKVVAGVGFEPTTFRL
jgi:hypothetical protein